MKSLALQLIKVYRASISSFAMSSCRFYPTCSQYAYQAIERHGVAKGSWLTLRRLSRCHPFHAGGVDEVP